MTDEKGYVAPDAGVSVPPAAPAGDAAGELQEELRQLRATVSQCDANKVTIAGINDTLLAECTRLRAALTAQGDQIAALRAALLRISQLGVNPAMVKIAEDALAHAPAPEPASSVKVLSANVYTPAVNPLCLAPTAGGERPKTVPLEPLPLPDQDD